MSNPRRTHWQAGGGVRVASELAQEWFKALRLPLAKPERGCLDDLCLACGF